MLHFGAGPYSVEIDFLSWHKSISRLSERFQGSLMLHYPAGGSEEPMIEG
jgi:hypothetical protein